MEVTGRRCHRVTHVSMHPSIQDRGNTCNKNISQTYKGKYVKQYNTQVWGVFQRQVLTNCIKALYWI